MARRSLLFVALLFVTLSLTLFISGGFVTEVVGVRLSARSPMPSLVAAAVSCLVWFVLAWRTQDVRTDLEEIDAWLAHHASSIALVVAALASVIALRFSTFSAGGSDASGYLSQAEMLWRGHLMRAEPLSALAQWANAAATLAPLGWRPALETGLQVPTYAVGLPILIAPLNAAGGAAGASIVIVVSLFMVVLATAALALRLSGPIAALFAAAWVATSPVALIEAMQPMSDVPVTAAWLLCWILVVPWGRAGYVRVFLGGMAAALAVLIRPNLAPLALIPALCLFFKHDQRPSPSSTVLVFAFPVGVAGGVVAYLQWRWFGSPFRSGYGTAQEIYAFANILPNTALYFRWLVETHGPWMLAAPLALIVPGGRFVRWLLLFAAAVVVAYLLYAVFEVWTYLRFMLPAMAIAMALAAALAAELLGRMPAFARVPAVIAVVFALAATNLAAAHSHGVFKLAAQQSRAALAGRYLASAVPVHGVLIAGEQSGSTRYYTGRSIVRWDFATPEALSASLDQLSQAGHEIWVALDTWEEEPFRKKFAGIAAGALDWPPRVEAGTELLMRAWRLRDREPFMRGENFLTDRLR